MCLTSINRIAGLILLIQSSQLKAACNPQIEACEGGSSGPFWANPMLWIIAIGTILFIINTIRRTARNPASGFAYFFMRISIWIAPFLMLYIAYLVFGDSGEWVYLLAFAFGGYLSFKLIDLNDKYFPFDEEESSE